MLSDRSAQFTEIVIWYMNISDRKPRFFPIESAIHLRPYKKVCEGKTFLDY